MATLLIRRLWTMYKKILTDDGAAKEELLLAQDAFYKRPYPSSIAYSDAYSRLEGVQTPVDVTRNATQRAPPQRCT